MPINLPSFRRVVGPDPNNGIRGDQVRPKLINDIYDTLDQLDGTMTGAEATVMQAATDRLATQRFDVREWFSPTGTDDDIVFINGAMLDLKAMRVTGIRPIALFPPTPTGYGVARVGGEQYSGIMAQPGVDMESLGATFHMRDNCHHIVAQSEIDVTATISANVALGDTSYTVTSAAGLVIGADVLIRLNTNPTDTPEPLWSSFARITDIVGNVVTLNTPALQACNVTTTTEAHNKRIIQFTELIDGNRFLGKWFFECDLVTGDAEAGLTARYAKNLVGGDFVGTNVGAAAVGFQFVETANIASIYVPHCEAPGGHTAKGRVTGWAESTGIEIGSVTYGFAENAAPVFVEHSSRGGRIGYLGHHNTESGRDAAGKNIVALSYSSDLHVDYFRATGLPEVLVAGDGLTVGQYDVDQSAHPAGRGGTVSSMERGIRINGTSYGPKVHYRDEIAITPSMPNVTLFEIPIGFVDGLWLTLANKTDTGTWYLSTGGGRTYDVVTSTMTAGVPFLIPNSHDWGGSGYGQLDYRYIKTLYVTTGAGVAANNTLIVEYDLFPVAGIASNRDQFVSRIPKGLLHPPIDVTGSRGGNAALESLLDVMVVKGFITDSTTS